MNALVLIIVAIVLSGAGIVLVGAPFVPTKDKQIQTALDLLDLKKGQLLLDFGSGDGRVALAAAKRGLRVRGYELNLILVLISLIKTRKYRKQISIRWQNYWRADLSQANGVYIFSAGTFMDRLDNKLKKTPRKLRMASFAFKVPHRKYQKQKNGVFLYEY